MANRFFIRIRTFWWALGIAGVLNPARRVSVPDGTAGGNRGRRGRGCGASALLLNCPSLSREAPQGARVTFQKILAAGAAVLFLAALPATADQHDSAPTISAPEIEFTEWKLDNGLRVIAIPDQGTSTVTTSMWYEVGSKLDPEGRSGFAHLFEHILSRKTEKRLGREPLTEDLLEK
ncbi:MAG: insulinase family protein, partial [Deinococcales bacterium]